METASKTAPALIAWNDGFKTGIADMDVAHRQLFDGVASLQMGMDAQRLAKLQEQILRHFAHEQDLMERSGYRAVEQHVKLHQEFAAQLAGFQEAGSSWDALRVQELRTFLNQWLTGHIMAHDMRFGKWYASQQARSARAIAANRPAHKPSGFFARLWGARTASAHH